MTHPLLRYLKNNPTETRETFCDRAKISRMTFWRLTNHKGEASTKLFRRIAEATDGQVSVAELAAAHANVEAQSDEDGPKSSMARAS